MNKVINITSNGIKQAIDDLVNENELLQDKVYKQNDKIERLNNVIKTKDEGIRAFTEDLRDTTIELEQANNIIKEVREYIKSIEHEPDADMYIELGQYEEYKHILEILDKGSD